MKRALDLTVLWIYCLVAAVFMPINVPFVVSALGAVVYACGSCLARSGGIRFGVTVVFLSLSLVCPHFLMFSPLVLYTLLDVVQPSAKSSMAEGLKGEAACGAGDGCDILNKRNYVLGVTVCCFAVSFYVASKWSAVCFTAVGCVVAGLLQYQTMEYNLLDEKFRRIRDDSVEKNLLLREKNQSILENQDYEVYTATLRERNRIAREIHDNVGHMLSRSILLVGAMKAVHGEGNLKDMLCQLEDTLNGAMTNVRESVHDLHDEAINLKETLESLVGEFTFCQADLEYNMGYDVPKELRYGFIGIVKEALHNVTKHSDAQWVQVVAREHPGLYQLIIEDNGTGCPAEGEKGYPAHNQEGSQGIGIRNMKERVDGFGGNMEIRTQGGWRIYITVPKKT